MITLSTQLPLSWINNLLSLLCATRNEIYQLLVQVEYFSLPLDRRRGWSLHFLPLSTWIVSCVALRQFSNEPVIFRFRLRLWDWSVEKSISSRESQQWISNCFSEIFANNMKRHREQIKWNEMKWNEMAKTKERPVAKKVEKEKRCRQNHVKIP